MGWIQLTAHPRKKAIYLSEPLMITMLQRENRVVCNNGYNEYAFTIVDGKKEKISNILLAGLKIDYARISNQKRIS